MIDFLSEPAKRLADASAALVAAGTLVHLLPNLAALLTVVWLAIRIWESDTVRAVTRRPLTGKRIDD